MKKVADDKEPEAKKAEKDEKPSPKPELKPIVADKVPDWNQPVVW